MQVPVALWVTCHVWSTSSIPEMWSLQGINVIYVLYIEWITDMQFQLFQLLDLPTADVYNVKSALQIVYFFWNFIKKLYLRKMDGI